MIGTEICPKCGTHFDGVWWRNAETENKQLREQLVAEQEKAENWRKVAQDTQKNLGGQLAAQLDKVENAKFQSGEK